VLGAIVIDHTLHIRFVLRGFEPVRAHEVFVVLGAEAKRVCHPPLRFIVIHVVHYSILLDPVIAIEKPHPFVLLASIGPGAVDAAEALMEHNTQIRVFLSNLHLRPSD